jgi:hypothetical protein
MPNPETPELEAVAWRREAQRYRRPNDPLSYLFSSTDSNGEPLTPLPAALALLAQRDERIATLEAKLREPPTYYVLMDLAVETPMGVALTREDAEAWVSEDVDKCREYVPVDSWRAMWMESEGEVKP